MNIAHLEGDCTALALDTSSSVLAAAITRNGRTVDASQSFTERNHSVRVVSDLRELMERNGVTREKLDLIAVGQGPGSYTGVRIAVSAAKTLAWAWNKPLVGVSSLESTAYSAWLKLSGASADAAAREAGEGTGSDAGSASAADNSAVAGPAAATAASGDAAAGATVWIVPLMDARRGQAYTSLFSSRGNGEWTREEKDAIRLVADWLSGLRERYLQLDVSARPSAVYLVGELAFLEGKQQPIADLDALRGDWPLRLEPSVIDAGAVGILAERKFRQGLQEDIHGFVPNYTQLTEAEVNLMKAGTGSPR